MRDKLLKNMEGFEFRPYHYTETEFYFKVIEGETILSYGKPENDYDVTKVKFDRVMKKPEQLYDELYSELGDKIEVIPAPVFMVDGYDKPFVVATQAMKSMDKLIEFMKEKEKIFLFSIFENPMINAEDVRNNGNVIYGHYYIYVRYATPDKGELKND